MKNCLILAFFFGFLLSSCQIGNFSIGGPKPVGYYSQGYRNCNYSKPRPSSQDTSAIIEKKQKPSGSINAIDDSNRIKARLNFKPDSTQVDSIKIKK